MLDEVINAKEAAKLLGLQPSTLYKYAENGTIACIKYNPPTKNPARRNKGPVRFYRSVVEAFRKSHVREAI